MVSSACLRQAVVFACLLCLIDSLQPVETRVLDPIMCVQCTPTDPRCESGNNIEPRECDRDHRFCAQYRVFIGESQGIFRGCSRSWLRGCRQTTIEDKDAMVCFSTCSWDGCNGGSFTSSLLH